MLPVYKMNPITTTSGKTKQASIFWCYYFLVHQFQSIIQYSTGWFHNHKSGMGKKLINIFKTKCLNHLSKLSISIYDLLLMVGSKWHLSFTSNLLGKIDVVWDFIRQLELHTTFETITIIEKTTSEFFTTLILEKTCAHPWFTLPCKKTKKFNAHLFLSQSKSKLKKMPSNGKSMVPSTLSIPASRKPYCRL